MTVGNRVYHYLSHFEIAGAKLFLTVVEVPMLQDFKPADNAA